MSWDDLLGAVQDNAGTLIDAGTQLAIAKINGGNTRPPAPPAYQTIAPQLTTQQKMAAVATSPMLWVGLGLVTVLAMVLMLRRR